MSDSESPELKKFRKDGKDRGLDEQTIQSLIDNEVTSFEQIHYFEDEDFEKLKLPKFKLKQLKAEMDKLKSCQDSKDDGEKMDDDCVELLKGKGLTDETIKELARIGVLRKSNLEVVTTKNIDDLKLKPATASVQKKILKKLVEDKTRPSVAQQGGISLEGVTFKAGNVTGSSSVGVVKRVGAKPNSGGVDLKDSKFEVGDVKDKSNAVMVESQDIPMELAKLPEDLVLGTTDEVVDVMSDGPLPDSFRVERCSPEFHTKHRENAYSMEKTTRGGALIINVSKVGETDPRYGTDVDRDKLKKLFEQLHFHVTVFNNDDGLSAQEIKDKVQTFAEEADEEKGEAYVVCLLSHGQNDCLYGTDGKLLPFDTVFSLFDDKHCQNLVGKPKMFFIQACRTEDPTLHKPPVKGGGRSDMLVCYATQAGYEAFRETTKGSWFVDGMTQVFARFAKQEEIIHMMFRVHYAVQKKLQVQTAENISPEIHLTQGRKLYFFPGIQM